MEANTCENANFRMPQLQYVPKVATPMNSHIERPMFTCKFCVDFAMQNPFKVPYGAHIQLRPGTNLSNILL